LLKEQDRETDRKIQELVETTWETNLALKKEGEEAERRFQETDREIWKTSRMIRELKQQISGLGNKFGSFTEGLALPSIEKFCASVSKWR
jgi:hypothetical protein